MPRTKKVKTEVDSQTTDLNQEKEVKQVVRDEQYYKNALALGVALAFKHRNVRTVLTMYGDLIKCGIYLGEEDNVLAINIETDTANFTEDVEMTIARIYEWLMVYAIQCISQDRHVREVEQYGIGEVTISLQNKLEEVGFENLKNYVNLQTQFSKDYNPFKGTKYID